VDLLTEKRVIRILACSTRIFYKKLKDFPAPKSTEDWGAIQEISTRVGIQAKDLIILLEIAQTEKAALERSPLGHWKKTNRGSSRYLFLAGRRNFV
jgi:hypothetical protein